MPFAKPLARTREYVEIVRDIVAREGPVTNDGPHYPLPYPNGTGLGKPLKSTIHPVREDIPIFLGAEGPEERRARRRDLRRLARAVLLAAQPGLLPRRARRRASRAKARGAPGTTSRSRRPCR